MVGSVHAAALGTGAASGVSGRSGTGGTGSFGAALRKELEQSQARTVEFSKHAISRAEERGIDLTPTLLERLNDSVERAEAKGAKNILALDRSLAFIVNVPNGRVITALSEDELKESVFTNIDGAVFL